jgi:hypothetical protein
MQKGKLIYWHITAVCDTQTLFALLQTATTYKTLRLTKSEGFLCAKIMFRGQLTNNQGATLNDFASPTTLSVACLADKAGSYFNAAGVCNARDLQTILA